MNTDHDRDLAAAFDGQAARFERAPVQTDPLALARLVLEADFPTDSLVLDAGCGPGLVSLALLEAGHRVVGVDLSEEMIARAVARCGGFAGRARFARRSIFDRPPGGPFDASISRYVLHHVADPAAFVGPPGRVAPARRGPGRLRPRHRPRPETSGGPSTTPSSGFGTGPTRGTSPPGAIVDLLAPRPAWAIRASEEAIHARFRRVVRPGDAGRPKD